MKYLFISITVFLTSITTQAALIVVNSPLFTGELVVNEHSQIVLYWMVRYHWKRYNLNCMAWHRK